MFAISQPNTPFEPGPQDTLALFLVGITRCADESIPEVKSARHNAIAWLVQAARMGLDPDNVRIFCAPMITLGELAEAMLAWDLERELKIRVLWIFGAMSHRARPPKDKDGGWDLLVSTVEGRIADQDFEAERALLPVEQLLLDLFPEYSHALADGFALTRLAYTVAREKRRGLDTARAQADAERLGVLLARAKSPDDDFAAQEIRSLRRFLGKLDGREHSLADVMLFLCHALDPGNYDPATPEHILKHLRQISDKGSRGLFAYTGHGQLGSDDGLELVTESTACEEDKFTHLLRVEDFKDALGESADRWTLVLDTCHAGGTGALQGSRSVSAWTRAGLDARIIAASNQTERAAEARFRHETLGAMTWALTTTLSRWLPVDEDKGRAMGVTNGNLVLRANMLLESLSLNQRISVSAPRPEGGDPYVNDLPFLGYKKSTLTSVDPNEQVGGIEISPEEDEVFALCFNSLKEGVERAGKGTPRALILVFGKRGSTGKVHFFQTSNVEDLKDLQTGFKLWVIRRGGTATETSLDDLTWTVQDGKMQRISDADSGVDLLHEWTIDTGGEGTRFVEPLKGVPCKGNLAIKWIKDQVTFYVKGDLRLPFTYKQMIENLGDSLTSSTKADGTTIRPYLFDDSDFTPTKYTVDKKPSKSSP